MKPTTNTTSGKAVTYWSLGISPVQSFIAEARRSRDLRAGSRILAWMAGSLLARLAHQGAEFLLPKLATDGEEKDELEKFLDHPKKILEDAVLPVPNRASGTLPMSLDAAQTLLDSLHNALAKDWRKLLKIVRKDASRSSRQVWQKMAPFLTGIACPLQLTWVACESSGGDSQGLTEVNALYSAAKRSRPIPSLEGRAPVRKCGQCGRREALGGDNPSDLRGFYNKLAKLDEVNDELRFSPQEHLCPICAVRRFVGYLDDESFPSTSKIATSEWRWRLSKAGFGPALEAIENAARQAPEFAPTWADRAPLFYETTARRKALHQVLAEQRKLAAAVGKSDLQLSPRPPDYLAVLMFDGDDMGKRLREHLDWLPQALLNFQARLEERLDKGGDDVAPLGKAFYLGGDEGLILAPVSRVLDLAWEICRFWHEEIDAQAEEPPPRPSFSMGITLFGRERPLGHALESARRALEDSAKRVKKKGALALSVQTASGNVWNTVAPWGESWERIRAAVDMIHAGELAAGWPHDVETFLRALPEGAFTRGESSLAAISAEVKRITFRRLLSKPGQEPSAERRAAAWDRLAGEIWLSRQSGRSERTALPEQLHLIVTLAQQATTSSDTHSPKEG